MAWNAVERARPIIQASFYLVSVVCLVPPCQFTIFTQNRKASTMPAMNALADNLRTLRTLHGLSQKDLAARTGTSHPRISEMERGVSNPTLATLEAIAGVFGITVSNLLHESKKNLEKVAG